MSMSNYLESGVLNHIFRNTAFPTLSGSLYLALYTSPPGEAGGGTEVNGGGYSRAAVPRASGSFSNANPTRNTAAISFAESTGAWGTVTHIGIFDAASGGNLLWYGTLSTSRTVDAPGITIRIPANDLGIGLD